MWESGAGTIVRVAIHRVLLYYPNLNSTRQILIDHNSRTGFESIIEARDLLLNMGKHEMEDPDTTSEIKGSHVVAPVCPMSAAFDAILTSSS